MKKSIIAGILSVFVAVPLLWLFVKSPRDKPEKAVAQLFAEWGIQIPISFSVLNYDEKPLRRDEYGASVRIAKMSLERDGVKKLVENEPFSEFWLLHREEPFFESRPYAEWWPTTRMQGEWHLGQTMTKDTTEGVLIWLLHCSDGDFLFLESTSRKGTKKDVRPRS
jgi:hypothetical protein